MAFHDWLKQFQDPSVRDLAWTIGAPPSIILANDSRWISPIQYGHWLHQCGAWLDGLDQNPDALHEVLKQPGQSRLGLYYERLIGFWLEYGSPYRLVAKNYQIQHDGRTVGEFDFLVEGEHGLEHWEVAIKYYLGVDESPRWENWLGPNQRDRLSKKLNHMMGHQATVSQTEAGQAALQALGCEASPTVKLWFKGHFFAAPTTHPSQPEGSTAKVGPAWLDADAAQAYVRARETSRHWIVRHKPDWLNPVVQVDDTALTGGTLLDLLSQLERPMMLSECHRSHHGLALEHTRLCIVPNGWKNRAQNILAADSLTDRPKPSG
ncbi:MAG: DUF1853 family protein [Myxococcota bacterium]|nr:DUF1853 family protein [Myxococcota bacterium]